MKRALCIFIVANLLLAPLLTGCFGGRTGLRFPDLPPSPHPPCSSTPFSQVFDIFPAPGSRSLNEGIYSISWSIRSFCDPTPSNSATDPSVKRLPPRIVQCDIIQLINGAYRYSGNCVTAVGSPLITITDNSPVHVGFRYLGSLQGSICVKGTMTLLSGATVPFDTLPAPGGRTWVRRSNDAVPIVYNYLVNGAGAPASFVPFGASTPGCPAG